jgi:hypothetical protein
VCHFISIALTLSLSALATLTLHHCAHTCFCLVLVGDNGQQEENEDGYYDESGEWVWYEDEATRNGGGGGDVDHDLPNADGSMPGEFLFVDAHLLSVHVFRLM